MKLLRLLDTILEITKRLFFGTLVVILFFSPFIIFSQSTYPDVYDGDSIIQVGISFYDNQEYDKALIEFDKIFKTDPQYAFAQYEKMLSLTVMEKTDQVRSELSALYKSDKAFDVPEAMILYGSILSNLKEFELSEKVFIETYKIIPQSPILLYNIGLLHFRKDDKDKCIEYLKKTIILNPNHTTAHYLLGLVCLEEGKIVQGALALLAYLVLDPTGEYAQDAVQKLNVKMSQNYLVESKINFNRDGDNFEELETILRNQLPLNPKYKLKSSVDEIFTRHIQAIFEYASMHEIKNGFFETTYMPWMVDISNKNLVEPATYYLIQIFKDNLGKTLTSKQKNIDNFLQTYVMKDFWNIFAKRKTEHFGTEREVIIFLDAGEPNLIGQNINGQNQGKFKNINKHGQVTGELNFSNDLLDGTQKYFNTKGTLIEEITYTGGVKNGIRKTYYSNGKNSITETYKNDMLDGPYTTYYPGGSKNCEGQYEANMETGTLTCYHQDGTKRLETAQVKNKLHGPYRSYNQAGDLTGSYTYLNGEINGEALDYYDGKILLSSGTYTNGKSTGPIKTFTENQQLKTQSNYESGKLISFEEYGSNGKLSEYRKFNTKEEVESITYFDISGTRYYEEKFSGSNFKSGYQYSGMSDKPVELKPGSDYIVRFGDGIISHRGPFSKGQINGKWSYFYNNGNLYMEQDMKDGIAEGWRKTYNKAGILTGISKMKGGKANGISKTMAEGSLVQIGYYTDDIQNGPYKVFRRDSSLNFEGYFVNGLNQGNFINYYHHQNIMSESKYIENELQQSRYFNIAGKVDAEQKFTDLNGEVTWSTNNGFVLHTENFTNGIRNGKSVTKEKDNILINEIYYRNGELHGPCIFYNQTETKSSESTYYCGKPHGTVKSYDLNGSLRTSGNYLFGVEYGTAHRYYQDGKPLFIYEVVGDTKTGEHQFYNLEGNIVAVLGYNMDYIEYYKVLDKSGKPGSPVAVNKDASVKIASLYPDGKTAFTLDINKSNWNGTLAIYGSTGLPNYTCEYLNGNIHGQRVEYYSNGKPYKKEKFIHNDYEGLQQYFDPSGQLLFSAEYKNDELNGELRFYKNGQLYKTKIYDTDILVDIKK